MTSSSAPCTPDSPSNRVRIISCAWGTEHLLDFLDYCLPALLSPGNLPALCEVFECELVFLTEEDKFEIVAEHPSWLKLVQLCPARLIALDDLLIGPDSYGMTLTQALHRGFSDQGPAMTLNWQVFFNSDFIVADGGLKRLAQKMLAGHRLIVSPSYCVNSDAAKATLDDARNAETGVITISNRAMAAMIIRHRHATIRGKTVNQPLFSHLHNDQFYWLVDNHTLIGHQLPIAMIAMMPLIYLPHPTTYWDYGIVEDFLPSVTPLVLADSDDFVMAELRRPSTGEYNLRIGPRSLSEMATSLHGFATTETAKMAAYQLILHSRDLGTGITAPQEKLAEIVRDVVIKAGELPHHQQHFQWSVHAAKLQEIQSGYGARNSKSVGRARHFALEPTVKKFSLRAHNPCECGQADIGTIAGSIQRRRSETSTDEAAIEEAIRHLLDPTLVTAPLSEAGAVELSVRFINVVDLLLQQRFIALQDAHRHTARKALESLIANPSAEMESAKTGGLLGPLRMNVSAIAGYAHGFDHVFCQQLSDPLTIWIQTLWDNAAALRDVVEATQKGSVPLETDAAIVKQTISNLMTAIQKLFPVEPSREDFESEIALVIREAQSSETLDMEKLGSLYVGLARGGYDRTLLDKIFAAEVSETLEPTALQHLSKTTHAFIDQLSQFAHILRNHKYQVPHYLAKTENRFRVLAVESGNLLAFVERLAGAISVKGILGIPLPTAIGRGRGRRLLRSFKRTLRWFDYSHAAEIALSKFIAEQGSLSEKTILHVDSGSSVAHSYTELARARYWLPLSIARTPLNLNQVGAALFDLCIVDFDAADPASFSLVYEQIERAMRPGSVVIFFARRMRGLELRRDDSAFIRGMFQVPGYTRISYTDSAAGRLAARIVEIGENICRNRIFPRPMIRLIEATALAMAAPLAWSAAWLEHRRIWPPDPSVPVNPTSVTLEVSVP
jgi:hypothetical protein